MNKPKSIFLSILLLLIVGGVLFYKLQNPNITSVLNNQLDINENNKSAIDTSFYVVSNKGLKLTQEVNLDLTSKIFVENRIKEYENKVLLFDEKTSLVDKVNAYFMLSADYRMLGDYGKSKELLEVALTIDPKNSNLMQVYSSLLSLMGDKESALIYVNKAIALHVNESNYWLWKIDLEKERGVVGSNLETVYKSALVATKSDANVMSAYAQFLEQEKRYQESRDQITKAMELYPENKAIYQAEIDRLKSMN